MSATGVPLTAGQGAAMVTVGVVGTLNLNGWAGELAPALDALWVAFTFVVALGLVVAVGVLLVRGTGKGLLPIWFQVKAVSDAVLPKKFGGAGVLFAAAGLVGVALGVPAKVDMGAVWKVKASEFRFECFRIRPLESARTKDFKFKEKGRALAPPILKIM